MATVSINPVRPRRVLELFLMLIALAVGIGGYVLTTLNRTGEVPANLGLHIGILVALAIVAEVGVHFLAPYADPVILPIAVALTGMGLAMIYRIDLSLEALGMDTVGVRQLMFVGIAIVLAAVVLVLVRDHRVLRRLHLHFWPGFCCFASASYDSRSRQRNLRSASVDQPWPAFHAAGRAGEDYFGDFLRRLPGY